LCTYVQILLYAARWRQYRVSNFKPRIFRFSAHVLLWFSEQRVQAGKIFYVVIMGNVTRILPVLHCLKRGIAFVSSLQLVFAVYDCVQWQVNCGESRFRATRFRNSKQNRFHAVSSMYCITYVNLCLSQSNTRRMAIANWTCVSWVAYAPGTIVVNVTRIEREFNACQTPRSMYPSIFNHFWDTAVYRWRVTAFQHYSWANERF